MLDEEEDGIEKTTIMVTGGSSCLGRALHDDSLWFATFQEEWIFLQERDGDLTKWKCVQRVFEQHAPTMVIHLASISSGLLDGKNQADLYYKNTIMLNIL